jgi:DNA end-binding protein Ku
MFFPSEIRTASEELDTLPSEVTFDGRELDVAKTLVDSLSVEWEPERYHNTYRAKIEELIEAKRQGNAVVPKAESKPKTNVVDLMSALEASVARAKGGGSADSDAPALADLTKPELLALATDYDIAGRSGMNKAELAAALTEAGATPKGRGRAASASA